MILKDQNTKDHSVWIIVNGGPMHGVCIPRRIISRVETAWINQEEEADKNHSKRVSMKCGK